jgi:hypothetical protein
MSWAFEIRKGMQLSCLEVPGTFSRARMRPPGENVPAHIRERETLALPPDDDNTQDPSPSGTRHVSDETLPGDNVLMALGFAAGTVRRGEQRNETPDRSIDSFRAFRPSAEPAKIKLY